jgi:hypothetical protein
MDRISLQITVFLVIIFLSFSAVRVFGGSEDTFFKLTQQAVAYLNEHRKELSVYATSVCYSVVQ